MEILRKLIKKIMYSSIEEENRHLKHRLRVSELQVSRLKSQLRKSEQYNLDLNDKLRRLKERVEELQIIHEDYKT